MKHLVVAAARSEVTCSASEQGMRDGVVNDAVRRTVELCGMPAPRQPTPFGSNYKSCFAYAVPLA